MMFCLAGVDHHFSAGKVNVCPTQRNEFRRHAEATVTCQSQNRFPVPARTFWNAGVDHVWFDKELPFIVALGGAWQFRERICSDVLAFDGFRKELLYDTRATDGLRATRKPRSGSRSSGAGSGLRNADRQYPAT